jgi:hypothetical protein
MAHAPEVGPDQHSPVTPQPSWLMEFSRGHET